MRPISVRQRTDALDSYSADLQGSEPMSRQQEREAFQLLREGGPGAEAARRQIVEANLRFVVAVASRYAGQIPLEDAIGYGNLGLLVAVDRFDFSRGYKFITYAVWWIRQAIMTAVTDQSRAARPPVSQVNDACVVERVQARLAQDLERLPTQEELTAATGLTASRVDAALRVRQVDVSFDAPMSPDGHNWLEKMGQDDPEADLDREVVGEVMERLRPREKYIVVRCYGLDDEVPQTLEQIGLQMGLTRERVRQLRNRALAKMRRDARLAELA